MSSKVRQLSKEEILPEDLNIAAVTINRTIEFYSAPEFYGKARAYFFTNFVTNFQKFRLQKFFILNFISLFFIYIKNINKSF